NLGISSPGVQLYGSGFILDRALALSMADEGAEESGARVVRPYFNARDLMQSSRDAYVIDFFGLPEEAARRLHPRAFQHLLEHVRPERATNRRQSIRDIW